MSIETENAAARIAAIAAAHGLTIACEFVPYSQSRNAAPSTFNGGEPWRSLNWRVRLMRNGAAIGEPFDYGQGEANAPAYKSKAPDYGRPAWGGRMSFNRDAAIAIECETGKRARLGLGGRPYASSETLPPPSLVDVLFSLAMDASALDYPTFEGWADDLGMSADSRAAESAYRACLATGLLLRSVLGESGLQELRDAAGEY